MVHTGPHFFMIYINYLCKNVKDAKFLFDVDNTILYASSQMRVVNYVQATFNVIQKHLCEWLVPDDKAKVMYFSRSKRPMKGECYTFTLTNEVIDCVPTFEYCFFFSWMKALFIDITLKA